MSNPKTAIQEIKKLMVQFGFMSEEVTLKSFKLEDNTILETKELKEGEEITKLSDEFTRVALESGSYRLVENFEIEVEDGKITAVKSIFVDAKLVDGTQIKVEGEELVEGAKVVVITEEGEIPAPDGLHELEGGIKVETKEGVVVKVEDPSLEIEVEKPEAEVELEEVAPIVEEVKDEIKEEEPDQMADFLALVKDMMEKLSEKMATMENKVESMNENFEAFKKEPAGKKISDGKTDFNKQLKSEDPLEAKLEFLKALRGNK